MDPVASAQRAGARRVTLTAPRHLRARRFRPQLDLGYHEQLAGLTQSLRTHATPEAEVARAIIDADEHRRALLASGVSEKALSPNVRYSTALRLLRDLVAQGWTLHVDD